LRSAGFNIEEAAGRRGVSPVILEKDFWVCWLLGLLFETTFKDAIVFKGGTSLSKVFGVVDRFSEDIDLSLAPDFLGIAEPEVSALSKGQASRWMKNAEAECIEAVRSRLGPELDQTVRHFLGERPEPWFEFAVDPVSHSPLLLFTYDTTQPVGFDNLKRVVKLEFGSPYRAAANRTPSHSFMDRRHASRGIYRLAMHGGRTGCATDVLGEGDDPSQRALSASR
jgi:hypothetical protein